MEFICKVLSVIEFIILMFAFISAAIFVFIFIVGCLQNRNMRFNNVFGFNVFNTLKKDKNKTFDDNEITVLEDVLRRVIRFISRLLVAAVFIAILLVILSYINTGL